MPWANLVKNHVAVEATLKIKMTSIIHLSRNSKQSNKIKKSDANARLWRRKAINTQSYSDADKWDDDLEWKRRRISKIQLHFSQCIAELVMPPPPRAITNAYEEKKEPPYWLFLGVIRNLNKNWVLRMHEAKYGWKLGQMVWIKIANFREYTQYRSFKGIFRWPPRFSSKFPMGIKYTKFSFFLHIRWSFPVIWFFYKFNYRYMSPCAAWKQTT